MKHITDCLEGKTFQRTDGSIHSVQSGELKPLLDITVLVKDQYGQQVFHPVCETAKLFASLAGTKTLTPHALNLISQMGYTVKMELPTPKGFTNGVFRKAYC